MGTTSPSYGAGGTSLGIGNTYIKDVGFDYDLIYRIEDNDAY